MDRINKLIEKLKRLLREEVVNEAKVTSTRIKLLKAIKEEMAKNPSARAYLRRLYQAEIYAHQDQLDRRLSAAKRSKGSILTQVPSEMRIKLRKAENEIRNARFTNRSDDRKDSIKKAVGDVVSSAATVIKIPVFAGLRIVKRIVPKVGNIVLFPLRLPGYLWSKFIEPDGKYEGSVVTRMSKGFERISTEAITNLENTVRRV